MARTTRFIDLDSLAYTQTDLETLQEQLFAHSKPVAFRIYLGSVVAHSVDGVKDRNLIPEQGVYEFEIYFSTSEGTLQIVGDGENDEHRMFIEGQVDWVADIESMVEEFVHGRRNPLRSHLSRKRVELLNVVAAVAIGATMMRMLPGFQIIFPPTPTTLLQFVLGATIIQSFIYRNRVYPFVEVVRDEMDKTGVDNRWVVKFLIRSFVLAIGLMILKQLVNPQVAFFDWGSLDNFLVTFGQAF